VIDDEKLKALIDRACNMPREEYAELADELTRGDPMSDDCQYLSARCFPFRDRDDANLGVVTLLTDITTLKRMDQMKSDFVSLVAHEIRSPLGSVLAQLDIVRDGVVGDLSEKQTSILDRSALRLRSLVSLVSELLDLAKMESGLLAQERQRFDLAELLAAQVSFLEPRAEKVGVALQLGPMPENTTLVANQQSIEEVVTNLLENAIKYTPEGGSVSVSLTRDDKELCVAVSDTGFGLSEEDQSRIFKRFFRVKNEHTRMITGTGLGLPIVKKIVDSHDGRVAVQSEVGQGSTFSVYLPIEH
jgi:signal transduction histidine kinase